MQTITCPVRIQAEENPENTAVVSHGHTVTYGQLDRHIERVSNYLQKKGIQSGQRAAVISYNSLEYIITLFALWRIGVTACLINIRLPRQAIQEQLKGLLCQTVLGVHHFKETLRESQLRIEDMDYFTRLDDPSGPVEASLFMEQEVTLMNTSGSTGQPKIVVHTFSNHYYSALGSNENISLHYPDRWLLCLPLYHVSGLSIVFRCFIGGGTVVLPPAKVDMIEMMKHFFVTHISLVPTQLIHLLSDPSNIPTLHQLKFILLGGGPIPQSIYTLAVEHQLPVYPTYGLSEMSSQVATTPPYKNPFTQIPRPKVLDYREILIAPDGEIQVRGEVLFRGYLVSGWIDRPLTDDGWYPTGDIGSLDDDGALHVMGRKDNMFISGGENIHPEEIEKHLLDFPEIEQAVVVPVNDPGFGQRPAAFIHFINYHSISIYKIEAQLLKHLPRYKIPVYFYAWPEEFFHQTIKPSRNEFLQIIDQPGRLISLR